VATDIFNGHSRSFNDIKDLLEGTQEEVQEEEAVTDDIGELIESLEYKLSLSLTYQVYTNTFQA
jgi:hypothetical protein